MLKLSDIVVTKACVPDLKASSREEVIRELIESLSRFDVFDPEDTEEMIRSTLERERKGSTGFGKGVAVPHARHANVRRMVAVIGRSSSGVDFAALDRAPVFTVFLLLSPLSEPDAHLAAMEKIFRHLQSDTFRRFLRQADSIQAIAELVAEADEKESA